MICFSNMYFSYHSLKSINSDVEIYSGDKILTVVCCHDGVVVVTATFPLFFIFFIAQTF